MFAEASAIDVFRFLLKKANSGRQQKTGAVLKHFHFEMLA